MVQEGVRNREKVNHGGKPRAAYRPGETDLAARFGACDTAFHHARALIQHPKVCWQRQSKTTRTPVVMMVCRRGFEAPVGGTTEELAGLSKPT
jgi:hypothetical protein